jgi:hypothetical protein
MVLNTKVQQFPSAIIEKWFNIRQEKFFELDSAEAAAVKKAPKIDF